MNTLIRYFAFVSVAVLIFSGCGSQIVPVTGKVQRNGQAVPGGSVLFRPVSSENKSAVGEIGSDGTFTMMTEQPGDGVMVGKYRVMIAGKRGSTDERTRTTYLGPRENPVEVVAGKKNEIVIDINEKDGWEAIKDEAVGE